MTGVHRWTVAGLVACLVLGGCASDGADGSSPDPSVDDGSAADPDAAPTSRHVLLIGLDGLSHAAVADPSSDMLALLTDFGAAGAVTVPDRSAGGEVECPEAWQQVLRDGAESDGAHLFDALVDGGEPVDVGVFTTSEALAETLVPDGASTSYVPTVAVAGLDPWPTAVLESEEATDEASRHVGEVTGTSITFLHTDLAAYAAADAAAAEREPIATTTDDDLVDALVGAADARRGRNDEQWLTIVVGGCAAGDGEVPIIVEGEGIESDGDLVTTDVSGVGSLVAEYLGVELDGSWASAPDGVTVSPTTEDVS